MPDTAIFAIPKSPPLYAIILTMAKILIADDEANILKLIGGMLRKLGYIVIMASDGKDAYEKAVE